MLFLGFPPVVLFDLKMRGGPLPDRHQGLGRDLVYPGQLDFTPEEAVIMREWLEEQPDELVDTDDRDAAVELINQALQLAGVCNTCGGAFMAGDQQDAPRCGRCGELWV